MANKRMHRSCGDVRPLLDNITGRSPVMRSDRPPHGDDRCEIQGFQSLRGRSLKNPQD